MSEKHTWQVGEKSPAGRRYYDCSRCLQTISVDVGAEPPAGPCTPRALTNGPAGSKWKNGERLRDAWRMYAAAALRVGVGGKEAAECADSMVELERERFGDP